MNYQHLQVAFFLSATVVSLPAAPQVAYERATYKITAEGYANFTGAYVAVGDEPRDTTNTAGRIDAEARLLGLAMISHGFALGPRVTLRGSTTDTIDVGEYSLIGIGRWGRVEFGRRRGLPDILTGYGPNAYQFVSAEFGPASGPSLDPDGGLQTSLLTQGLGDQINHLTSLGITASLFFDESPKIIYVAPKTHGFLGGISFSPNADNAAGDYAELVQTGLVYEKYWQQNVVRIGGTYAYANSAAHAKSATFTDDGHSLSGGVALTWHDDLTLAASFAYNGNTGLQQLLRDPRRHRGCLRLCVQRELQPWAVERRWLLSGREERRRFCAPWSRCATSIGVPLQHASTRCSARCISTTLMMRADRCLLTARMALYYYSDCGSRCNRLVWAGNRMQQLECQPRKWQEVI